MRHWSDINCFLKPENLLPSKKVLIMNKFHNCVLTAKCNDSKVNDFESSSHLKSAVSQSVYWRAYLLAKAGLPLSAYMSKLLIRLLSPPLPYYSLTLRIWHRLPQTTEVDTQFPGIANARVMEQVSIQETVTVNLQITTWTIARWIGYILCMLQFTTPFSHDMAGYAVKPSAHSTCPAKTLFTKNCTVPAHSMRLEMRHRDKCSQLLRKCAQCGCLNLACAIEHSSCGDIRSHNNRGSIMQVMNIPHCAPCLHFCPPK